MNTSPRRTADDRYPSRIGGSAEISERTAPLVWGDDGPLSGHELRRYERDGFLMFSGLLPESTVAECLEAVSELERGAYSNSSAEVAEPGDDAALRSLFQLDRHPAFAALMARPELADVARQLLGSDVTIHQSRLNLKRAFEGRGFPWHSDFETWHVEDGMPEPRAVSCSVALTPNHAHNGPLHLIAGSHRWFVSCPGRTPSDHHLESLRRQEYGVPDEKTLTELGRRGSLDTFTGPAGSVVFFECNVMHGSGDNISPEPRTNAFFVYNSVENALEAPYGAEKPRPEHLAARSAEPVGRSAGSWPS
ncbi:MAG: phytanoyl-CoA dioxygenase family protein [Acidimicrobiales bacterium]